MIENPETKASSMDELRAVHECMGCSVLAENMAYVSQHNLSLGNHILDKKPYNLEFEFKNMVENSSMFLENIDEGKTTYMLEQLQSLSIYDASFDDLATKYLFPSALQKDLKLFLNLAAYTYLSINGQVWLKKVLPSIEEEIEQLTNAAERFSYYLKPMTRWDDNYNHLFDNQPVHKLINETYSNLTEIMSLKEKLREGVIGQLAKLDDNRPLGNLGLHEFINMMWTLWHCFLGRSVIQKYDGINGRKQFLEFLTDCLTPVHPKLVEGYFVDGPIDNALKKFQRNLKSQNNDNQYVFQLGDK